MKQQKEVHKRSLQLQVPSHLQILSSLPCNNNKVNLHKRNMPIFNYFLLSHYKNPKPLKFSHEVHNNQNSGLFFYYYFRLETEAKNAFTNSS